MPELRQLMAADRTRGQTLNQLSRWVILAIVAFMLPASAPAVAMAGPNGRASVVAITPGDKTATSRLLKAEYRFLEATVAHTPAIVAAETQAAEALGHECKGVLKGVPDESVIEEEGPLASGPKLSGRAQGEQARSEQEKRTIDQEIYETIFAAAHHVVRRPYEAFIATSERLTWSNPTINALVHQEAARLRNALLSPTVAVCHEMKTWAGSGFHVLPPGSKNLKESTEVRGKQPAQGNLKVLLRSYEGQAERTIVQRIVAIKKKLGGEQADEGFSRANFRMELALGEQLSRFAERQLAPVIGNGRTSAGTIFVVRGDVGKTSPRSCKHEVEIEVHEGNGTRGDGFCLNAGTRAHPSSSCSGSVETVELATPPDVRQARVHFSDRRTVTVSVVHVPAKNGGPAGVFIDAFRGYDPYPVSVQELGRDGSVMRTVSLSRLRCIKESAADQPGPPQSVTLTTTTAPSGEPLTISGTLHQFRGQTEFFLDSQPSIRNSDNSEEQGESKQFQWEFSTECAPHPYSLIDGILVPPGASVLVRTPTGLTPLTKVDLAASMHAAGPLFYGVFATPPSEIVVERSDGSVLYTESLAAKASEETEFCEGFAER